MTERRRNGHADHGRVATILDASFSLRPRRARARSSTVSQRDPQTYAIIGAAMEVHRVLGSGFLEPVYQDARELEFLDRGIPFRREAPLSIDYKGRQLPSKYRADFLCYDRVIVELKALRAMSVREDAQIIHYLKASGLGVALLLNFAGDSLWHQRFVR
jgi:GxxExxY protein